MQQVKNYGSFLQAFSLKKTIESLGHVCNFINIIPGTQIKGYQVGKFYRIKLLQKRLVGWDFLKRFYYIFKYQKRFTKEFLPNLGVEQGTNDRHYDVVVIGSDEVFNCTQKTWFGFSRQLFGAGLNTEKVITYAASFGSTTIERLKQMGLFDEISSLLKKIQKISVRDKNSFDVVCFLTGIKPELNVDPVLIFDYTQYMPEQRISENFLLVYTYPERMNDKDLILAVRKFANKRGLKIISIGHYFSWVDNVVTPTPFEVLAYFRDANYIVTDTFHGSVMSIKYNKLFCTIVRDMNSNKLNFLLSQFGLKNRIVNAANLSSVLSQSIDYSTINEIIKRETISSLNYLKENL